MPTSSQYFEQTRDSIMCVLRCASMTVVRINPEIAAAALFAFKVVLFYRPDTDRDCQSILPSVVGFSRQLGLRSIVLNCQGALASRHLRGRRLQSLVLLCPQVLRS